MAYTLKGSNGSVVRFIPFQSGVVEKESESYSSTVTSNPIENGAEINDHVNNGAGTLSLSGTIVGGESAINALKAMRNARELVTYTGVTRMSNLVFTSLKFDRSHEIKNGAEFSATLKQILNSTIEAIAEDAIESMLSQDADKNDDSQLAETSNAGLLSIAYCTVSASSAERYNAAYSGSEILAPLMRVVGFYDGLS